MRYKIYLDDERTPNDKTWTVVRNYGEFIKKVFNVGIENISIISFDHDLGDTAIEEYYNNVMNRGILDYDNIQEKTGYDAAKWLVNDYMENYDDSTPFPKIYVHSANPIGASNIIGYVNGFLKHIGRKQNAELKVEPFTVQNND